MNAALEWIRALVPIGAALIVTVLGARVAERAFRRQKSIERRVRWHEAMVRRLSQIPLMCGDSPDLDERATQALRARIAKTVDIALLCHIYAEPNAIRSVRDWMKRMPLSPDEHPTTSDTERNQIADACFALRRVLIDEARREYGARALKVGNDT